MVETGKGVYRRRHPERTDYYRIIEANIKEFLRSYPDRFEEKYGFLRTETKRAIYAFLDCGIPENGMARVRCDECGHDFFVAFSCRCRVVCPSCSTKRSILFAYKIAEIVISDYQGYFPVRETQNDIPLSPACVNLSLDLRN